MFKLFIRESQTITQEARTQAVDFLLENDRGLRRVPLGGSSVLGIKEPESFSRLTEWPQFLEWKLVLSSHRTTSGVWNMLTIV